MSGHPPSDADAVAANDFGPGDERAAAGSPRKREALELFRELPRHYDLLSSALSFGQDPRWRRALVTALAPVAGARVLDVATGTGMVAAELLSRTDCTVLGIDQSPQMLAAARRRFAGNARVELLEGEAEALPFADHSFDALTFTYLLRYVDAPASTMRELARVVRPGGRVASLEFYVPPWRPAYWAWRFYTAVGLPTLGRIASREWAEVGRFLGPSIRSFYAQHPLQRIAGYWRDAGLIDLTVRPMSLGGGVVISATRGIDAPAQPPSPGEAMRLGGATHSSEARQRAASGEAGDARGA
ncbi:MAG TPA: class I SAM-dependent methyltransferase [Solirubrobacteraceae bacterium]|jgi:demethylmenaquinone methyltransferase/2-methoxy-6-polyprenyl-1,4-benzoquinol methylase|nr:class I SAM-dependent methyltransferase [Solirubrobacteraceae bacterium]